MTSNPSSRYARDHARTYVLLAQPVDARQRPEVHQHHMAAQLGGAEWLGVEPPGRPVEGRHVHPLEDAHLAKALERRSDLGGEELRLLPGGEVTALVDLVEIDEVGVDRLRQP